MPICDKSNDENDEITIELAPLPPEKRGLSQKELFEAAGVVILGVPHFPQREFSWCYAACGQMILAAYEIDVRQCDIVSGVKQNPACCDDSAPLVCVATGADHADIAPIYTSRGINAVRQTGVIPKATLQNILNGKRPVEITRAYREQPGNFHAVVIKGFQNNMLLIQDPDYTDGDPYSYPITYQTLIGGVHFTWDDSWRRFPPIT